MKVPLTWVWLSLAASIAAAPADGSEPPAARVVLLANRDDAGSLRIARHYATARGVPAGNIVALPMPDRETITWPEFVSTIWNPLLDELVRGRWIDAIPMSLNDAAGRRKHAPHGHRIAALVVCRGVPLRIAHEPGLYAETQPLARRVEFRTNAGAVDAELSLLAVPNYPIDGLVPNPLFANERPAAADGAQVVKVSRLDGPSAADAAALVDRALAAERHGLLGRAYVDLAGRDRVGDEWLGAAAKQLEELGFDLTVHRESATFPATSRMDAPVLYFGWYSGNLDGPFALPGFRFPAGAIALHIHSYSAHTLRSTTNGWAGPLLARGVTATAGNVHEPYLEFTHQPHLLLRALAAGATLVEAAYYSLRALSWQAVLIGDPLYRPFPQVRHEPAGNGPGTPSSLAGYAAVREMRKLEASGPGADALARGLAALRETPNLALAYEVAQRLEAAGDRDAAARTVGFVPRLGTLAADQWALAADVARLIERCGHNATSVDVWKLLLAQDALPAELRLAWLPEATAVANAARDMTHARGWQAELDALRAPVETK